MNVNSFLYPKNRMSCLHTQLLAKSEELTFCFLDAWETVSSLCWAVSLGRTVGSEPLLGPSEPSAASTERSEPPTTGRSTSLETDTALSQDTFLPVVLPMLMELSVWQSVVESSSMVISGCECKPAERLSCKGSCWTSEGAAES